MQCRAQFPLALVAHHEVRSAPYASRTCANPRWHTGGLLPGPGGVTATRFTCENSLNRLVGADGIEPPTAGV
jgi:hypothetical protein